MKKSQEKHLLLLKRESLTILEEALAEVHGGEEISAWPKKW